MVEIYGWQTDLSLLVRENAVFYGRTLYLELIVREKVEIYGWHADLSLLVRENAGFYGRKIVMRGITPARRVREGL